MTFNSTPPNKVMVFEKNLWSAINDSFIFSLNSVIIFDPVLHVLTDTQDSNNFIFSSSNNACDNEDIVLDYGVILFALECTEILLCN